MSLIDDINRAENRFIDVEQQIEYLFLNFPKLLSLEEKHTLIARHGKPRRIPLTPTKIESEFVTVELPKPRFESQIIHYEPSEQSTGNA